MSRSLLQEDNALQSTKDLPLILGYFQDRRGLYLPRGFETRGNQAWDQMACLLQLEFSSLLRPQGEWSRPFCAAVLFCPFLAFLVNCPHPRVRAGRAESFSSLTALLRSNLHAIKFTCFRCALQRCLGSTQGCASIPENGPSLFPPFQRIPCARLEILIPH